MKASQKPWRQACMFHAFPAFLKELFVHTALGRSWQVHPNSPVAHGCVRVCVCFFQSSARAPSENVYGEESLKCSHYSEISQKLINPLFLTWTRLNLMFPFISDLKHDAIRFTYQKQFHKVQQSYMNLLFGICDGIRQDMKPLCAWSVDTESLNMSNMQLFRHSYLRVSKELGN